MADDKKKEKSPKKVLPTLGFVLKTAWKKRPGLFAVYLLQLVADVSQTMLLIILPKYLIDYFVAIAGGASFSEYRSRIVGIVVAIVLVTFFTSLIPKGCRHICTALGEWFNRYLSEQLADRAMSMDYEHTEDPAALDQLNKAREGASWYSGGVQDILASLYRIVYNIAVIVGVVSLLVMGCPWVLLIQGAGLLLISWFNYRNNKIEVKSFLELSALNRKFGYYFYRLADFRYGKDIRLYDSADMMGEKAARENKKIYEVWKRQALETRKNALAQDVISRLRDGGVYFYVGLLMLKGAISIGDFSMYCTAAENFYWSVSNIVFGMQDIIKRCSYLYEYIRFLDYPAAMEKGTEPVSGDEHVIEFRDVSFHYPRSETYVLRHVNLTIRSGEHLSIVGQNGAGKTTFIKLLCRLYDVTEGEILVDGKNIRRYSDEEYRKLFAVVFQDFQLFAFTLKENVALQDSEHADPARVEEALRLSGVYDDAIKLENGMDTVIYKSFDDKGTELSGGQKQKVAISRALYKNAPIVILDEPTAALDPVAEYEIYRKFHRLVGGKTALYISHRLSSCKFCDHIAVFAEDTIKEYGTHEELVNKPGGIYAEMFAAQAQYYV